MVIASNMYSDIEVPASAHSVTLTTLNPGTQYACSIKASTRKGFGQPCRISFWTKPIGNAVLLNNKLLTTSTRLSVSNNSLVYCISNRLDLC